MDWRYLAGFFDGEGCIRFYQSRNNYVFQITQQKREVLDIIAAFLKSQMVESVRIYKYATYPSYKSCYFLRLGRKADIQFVLSKIEPFLIVKRHESITLRGLIIHNERIKVLSYSESEDTKAKVKRGMRYLGWL